MRTWILALLLAASVATPALADERPNIVLVLVDDFNARLMPHLPRLQQMFPAQGLTLDMTAPTPVCAPSRATILTGRYAHNHGVRTNGVWAGGIWALQRNGNEQRTYAVWLDDAGYTTGHFGKYINWHEGPTAQVPPGWDAWASYRRISLGRYDFDTVETGNTTRTIAGTYDTDFFAAEASSFVANAQEPFLAVFSPMSPHGPFAAAERHRELYDDLQIDWPPTFSGDEASILSFTQTRLRMMQAVEDGIEALFATLAARGVLDRTYVFFTSDHGLFMGEHGFPNGKGTHYEETTRVPLYVRGPGVPIGRRDSLIVNTDLAPTFADLAGVTPPTEIDGRSFAPLLRGGTMPLERSRVLLEWFQVYGDPDWSGLRSPTRKYVEFLDGSCAMYLVDRDPFERRSRRCRDSWGRKAAVFVDALNVCAGEQCRALENSCDRPRRPRCP
jgi:N-acetylglucosamine-6-sulfatase